MKCVRLKRIVRVHARGINVLSGRTMGVRACVGVAPHNMAACHVGMTCAE